MTKEENTSNASKTTSKASKGGKKHANATSFNSETAKAAQKKSRESLKRNRSMREWAKFYGAQHIKLKNPQGVEEDATWDGAVVVGLYKSAMAGDSKAAKMIADLKGESPEQVLNVNANVNTKREPDMTPEQAARFVAELNKHI